MERRIIPEICNMIMGLIILLMIIFCIVAYLLFAPFSLTINTLSSVYSFRFHWIASVTLITKEYHWGCEVRIFGLKKFIPFEKKTEGDRLPEKKKERNEKGREKSKKRREIKLEGILSVLRSFQVKKFQVSLSFSSMPINGILYPAFYTLSCMSGKDIAINFSGNNELTIEIQNNIFRMARAYFRS